MWPLWLYLQVWGDKRKTYWEIACVVITHQHFLSSGHVLGCSICLQVASCWGWWSHINNDVNNYGNRSYYHVEVAYVAGTVLRSIDGSSKWILTTTLRQRYLYRPYVVDEDLELWSTVTCSGAPAWEGESQDVKPDLFDSEVQALSWGCEQTDVFRCLILA